ncbi:hypothetical protein BDZ89DRAFT_187980 [Hymenopellis radicata]|nr:hypothetical protein BDZ89DRAFT_187980 [Hymenopellis radicata]
MGASWWNLCDLLSGFTKNWANPTTLCFDAIFDNSLHHVLCLVEPLEVRVRAIVTDEMESEGASVILKKIVELETKRVYSSNPDFYEKETNGSAASDTSGLNEIRQSLPPWKTVPDSYLTCYKEEPHIMAIIIKSGLL